MSAFTLADAARHEFRLAWRDWTWLFRRKRSWRSFVGVGCFFVLMQLIALAMVATIPPEMLRPGRQAWLLLSASALLSWMMMLSQAMEQVTRVFYHRADLDLILSSPVSAGRIFAVRLGAIALSVTATALVAVIPFVNALMLFHGPRYGAAYGVVAAMGASGVAVASLLTVGLLEACGPRRTRMISQIVAGIVGAAFVIGIQIAAVLSIGKLSRFEWLRSPAVLAHAPDEASGWWMPARAMTGDLPALLIVLIVAFAAFGLVVRLLAPGMGMRVIVASGAAASRLSTRVPRAFVARSPAEALRRKEWRLLARDPWLLSQTLTQLFYLIPPAILLWRNFSGSDGGLAVIAPLLVMTAGQLSGGLSWLAVSGEDAPDLVASAPIRPKQALRAKTVAVLTMVGIVLAPFLVALGLFHPRIALASALAAGSATAASCRIQLWFRAQASRSQYRRRQTSSRVATFCEAFSSVFWSATAGIAATGSVLWIVPAVMALLSLAVAWRLRPRVEPTR